MNQKDRKSPRLKHWDYGSDAAYFITICTKDRVIILAKSTMVKCRFHLRVPLPTFCGMKLKTMRKISN